ncbi:CS1 type fimbrial major subunit [Marinomonas shanghaiensis]|uniref:CS1 type fimbrial major subunit n=1 Tax=Marinomonas shanghaiensis TaxID=2202418 RepID=UPI000DBAD35B|nr:CS1 type fimbrial major subunit [Marinomonas shanghaiensis]
MKNLNTVLASAMLLSLSASGFAAQTEQKQITVIAEVPSTSFFVNALPGDDVFTAPQRMEWNTFNNVLTPIQKQLHMGSTTGAIQAAVTSSTLTGSLLANTIDLAVSVNGVTLSSASADVLGATQAAAGQVVNMTIAPATGANYTPDNYSGVVSLSFETPLPNAEPAPAP